MELPVQGISTSHFRNVEEHGNHPKDYTLINWESDVDFSQKTLIMRIQINEGWIAPAVYVLCCVYTRVVSGDVHTWLGLVKEKISLFACKWKANT